MKAKKLPKPNQFHAELTAKMNKISNWRQNRYSENPSKFSRLCTILSNKMYEVLCKANAIHVYILVNATLYDGRIGGHCDSGRFATLDELYASRAFVRLAKNDEAVICIMRRPFKYDDCLYTPDPKVVTVIKDARDAYIDEVVNVPELDLDMSRSELSTLISSLKKHLIYSKM